MNWKSEKLSNLINLEYGKALKSDERIEGEVAVYGSNGIIGYHNTSIVDFQTIIIGRKGSVGESNLSFKPCWVIDTAYYTKIKDAEKLAFSIKNVFLPTDS